VEVKVLSYRRYSKSTLQGFVVLSINGLKIKDCSHHIKGNREWINFPSKSYDDNGQKKWASIVEWEDKADHWKFQDTATAALAEYLKQ
jgi:hypothetical protein